MTSDFKNISSCAVIGANSMIGSRFCELFNPGCKIIKTDLRSEIPIDITDPKSVSVFFKNFNFDAVILFSAFTDVDAAERQRNDKKDICWKINVQGTKNIISLCLKFQKKLVFISSETIFDGTAGPYAEESLPGPNFKKVSWYGITKFEAEKEIIKFLSDYLIIRVSYPYRAKFKKKDDFARTMLHKYKEGNLYPMFTDQIFTPTFIDDLAPAVELLFSKNERGTFHLASPKTTIPFEFAKELLETFGLDGQKLKKGSLLKFLKNPKIAPRPIKGGLKVDKIMAMGFKPTNWKEGIEKIFIQSSGQLI